MTHRHALDTAERHVCGGLLHSGPDHDYCERCRAFAHDGSPVHDGSDEDANRAAWDAGDDASPAAAKISYEVIEDNGGGLSLYVSRDDRVIYSHSGYEYCPGQLAEDIAVIAAGVDSADIAGWDGCGDDPQAERDDWGRFEFGWDLVADETGTYPAKMGAAARLEFGEVSA